jgi:hypothetical protein
MSKTPSSLQSAGQFTTNSKLSSFKSIKSQKPPAASSLSTTTPTTLTVATDIDFDLQQQHLLSPSPLAICDGSTITYGNSNLTQTFKPNQDLALDKVNNPSPPKST